MIYHEDSSKLYAYLAGCLKELGRSSESESMLERAMEFAYKDPEVYLLIGWNFSGLGLDARAEEAYKKAIENDPQGIPAYLQLAAIYVKEERYEEAITLYKQVLKIEPANKSAYASLRTIYTILHDPKSLGAIEDKWDFSKEYYNPLLEANYLELKEKLDKQGVQLVCIQYPSRDIKELYDIFAGDRNVILIDTSKAFEHILKDGNYSDYFLDWVIGGGFGHFSEKGSRFFAGYVGDILLRDYFGIQQLQKVSLKTLVR